MKNRFWLFASFIGALFIIAACNNDVLPDEEIEEVVVIDFRDDLVGDYKVTFTERQYLPPTDPGLPNPYPIDTIEVDKIIQIKKPVDYPLYDNGMRGRLLVDGKLLYASIDSSGSVSANGSAGSWDEVYYCSIPLPNISLTWNDKWDGIRYFYSGEKQ